MFRKLTRRQEGFCLNFFQLGNATQAAISAGYSVKTAAEIASENLTKPMIQQRIQELREAAASSRIMSVIERKERLSEIAKARLSDYMTCGPDGSWVNIGLETVNGAALQEIVTKTEYDDAGAHPTIITRIKLRDPVGAIAELNKMDGAYAPEKQEHTGPGGGPVQVQRVPAPTEQLVEVLRILREVGAIPTIIEGTVKELPDKSISNGGKSTVYSQAEIDIMRTSSPA